jgi:hypothetical protein
MPSRDGQRAAPVVVPDEGLAAGGGAGLTAVDPGVPPGPGLLATCVVFHGPHVRIATASSSCLGDQRQDAFGDVDSNDL